MINAAGVFVDAVRRLDEATAEPVVSPSQGAHLVLDASFFPGDTALLVPRTADGRVIFAIPWHGRVLVGTTDTPVADVVLEPRPLRDEIAYLLGYLERYFNRAPGRSDVRSAFAGLRPLLRGKAGEQTARLSREHAVMMSESGLVTITGGKWTTYRRMAIDAVDCAIRAGALAHVPSATEALKLHGSSEIEHNGTEPLQVYGSDASALQALCSERPAWAQALHPSLPYLAGEVVWAARHEAARCVHDVLARRTRALFLDARASSEAAATVAALLAAELGRSAAWQTEQTAEFKKLAATYLP